MPKSRNKASSSASVAVYVTRLGHHHFAYLRAYAEGLEAFDIAQRYLGITHGHEVITAHRQVVDAVRAVARRSGQAAWRLVGLIIRPDPRSLAQPSLEDFIEERDLYDWSAAEALDMYEKAYPAQPQVQPQVQRKHEARLRLRLRQRDLLHKLESLAAETPKPEDLISGWFDGVTAQRLLTAGMVNLGDLRDTIAVGGRWYRTMPGVGSLKASRISAHLNTLIAPATPALKTVFSLDVVPMQVDLPASSDPLVNPLTNALVNVLDNALAGPDDSFAGRVASLASVTSVTSAMSVTSTSRRTPPSNVLLQASSDAQAVQAWVNARAGSAPTAKAYRREAHRLLLWLQYECRGQERDTRLADMGVEDCRNFMAFLQHIPAQWISRVRASPGQPGWAPFKGPLSHQSQRQAIVIVSGLFAWLHQARYIQANPWVLVNTKTGDDAERALLDTKSFSEAAYKEVLNYVKCCPPTPSSQRMVFILEFVESVGLRSAELIAGVLGDVSLQPEGYVMAVHGKGSKNRVVVLPAQAMAALRVYLESRHLGGIDVAPGHAPLVASTLDAMEKVGYQALYESVKSWLARAVAASGLPAHERARLAGASTHWLRHTFGTRAVARDVPLDVIQAQLGHASIQTTMSIYGRAPIKRRADELGRAFG